MKNQGSVAIVDFKMGNLFSISNACEYVGLSPVITSDVKQLMACDAAILPGVGAFGEAMHNLEKLDLVRPVKDFIASGKPFMGICLGLQLLFSCSEEFGYHEGLDVIRGEVKKFPAKDENNNSVKVPLIGWNRIRFKNDDRATALLRGIDDGDYMYFVHSYYVVPIEVAKILTVTNYAGIEYCSSVHDGNVVAFQFHPEKSAWKGLAVYSNFKDLVNRRKKND